MTGNTSKLSIEIAVNEKGAVTAIRRVGTASEKAGKKGKAGFLGMSRGIDKTNRKATETIGLLKTMVSTFAIYKTAQVAAGFLETASSLERMELMLRGVIGTVKGGQEAFNWLLDFSATAPFNIDALSNSFVKLQVAGLDPMSGAMQSLIDAVAHFGGDSETLKRASVAIQQMAGKGVISMEELRQQLGEAIPSAIKIMAREMGMSIGELTDQVSKGAVDAQTGLSALFTGFEKDFSGSAARMMTGWKGLTAQLSVQWKLFQKQVMDNDVFVNLKAGIKTVIGLLGQWKKEGDMSALAKSLADSAITSFGIIIKGAYWLGEAFLGWKIIWSAVKVAWDGTQAAIWKGMAWLSDKVAALLETYSSIESYFFIDTTGVDAAAQSLRQFASDTSGAADILIDDIGSKGVGGIQNAVAAVESLTSASNKLKSTWEANKAAMLADPKDSKLTKPTEALAPTTTALSTKEIKAMDQTWSAYEQARLAGMSKEQQAVEKIRLEYDKYREAIDQANAAGMISIDDEIRYIEDLDQREQEALNTLAAKTGETSTKMSQAWISAHRNMQSFTGDTFYNLLKGNYDKIGGSFEDMVTNMVAQWGAAQMQMALFGNDSSSMGGLLGMAVTGISSYFAGPTLGPQTAAQAAALPAFLPTPTGRAIGGTTAPRGMYEINEEGMPEVFTSGGRDFLMVGSQGGAVKPASRAAAGSGGNAPVVQVNIHNAPGTEAAVQQSDDGMSLDVIISKIEDGISGNVQKGTGSLAGAMEGTYGLNRAAGGF